MQKIYEGKAKILYEGRDADHLIHYFKDSATAFNGEKKDEFSGKGELNCKMTVKLLRLLEAKGIRTHLVSQPDERSIETLKLEMIPLEVVVRNRIAGSLARKLPKFEGRELDPPLVEWYLKDDEQKDPQISEDLILNLFPYSKEDLQVMKLKALTVNEILRDFFRKASILLIDFKLEFGRTKSEILLADEISPDTCRLWDQNSLEKLDKDRYRFDLGDLMTGYREVWKRIENL